MQFDEMEKLRDLVRGVAASYHLEEEEEQMEEAGSTTWKFVSLFIDFFFRLSIAFDGGDVGLSL